MTEKLPTQPERVRLDGFELTRQLQALRPRVGSNGRELGDRAALAALRRGLGKEPGEAPADFLAVLFSILPQGELSRWDERVAYLVASLFALYPDAPPWPPAARERWQRNLGASLRQLAEQTDSNGPERRFVALLNSDVPNLSHHLRGIVSLLKSAKQPVPIDWMQLTRDMQDWNDPEREVQRRWAGAFWGGRRLEEPAADDDAIAPE
ncbi:MAG: type I-E CRISPR-associated protein Cse2/CasB [Thermomicrobiales bacterium]|nr:type I-E CRISPR-associated protein Cse2/CasB [Thermomicrobiales bacterium]